MEMLLAHAIGDWLLQSQYMASMKVRSAVPALLHVTVYGIVYWVLVGPSWLALVVIVGTHYLIDRYRLARHVNWAANFIAPVHWVKVERDHPWALDEFGPRPFKRLRSTNPPWSECSTYGSPPGVPDHIAFIVMIAVDQILHLVLNWAALRWLG